ncbi:MAG: hypothetical protein V1754_02960, partial [Pseudomonadota bacterium]
MLFAFVFCTAEVARAGWASDEQYVNQLKQKIVEVTRDIAPYESHCHTLNLLESQASGLKTGFAQQNQKPDLVAQKILKQIHPGLQIEMQPLETKQPKDAEVWRWQCTMRGPLFALKWATEQLRQEGLFILPSANEPVTLKPDTILSFFELSFVGHHVRLGELPVREPFKRTGDNLLDLRKDLVATDIIRLQNQLTGLHERVLEIKSLPGRVQQLFEYIKKLKIIAQQSRDPWEAFAPLANLELIHFNKIELQDKNLQIWGDAISSSANAVANEWFAEMRKDGWKIQVNQMGLLFSQSELPELPVPAETKGQGGLGLLMAVDARPVDFAAAANSHATVVHGRSTDRITGQTSKVPRDKALTAAIKNLGFELFQGRGFTLLAREPHKLTSKLTSQIQGTTTGKKLALFTIQTPLSDTLSILGKDGSHEIRVPKWFAESTQLVSLSGYAPQNTWLSLLGAAVGLQTVQKRNVTYLVHPFGVNKR